MGLTHCPLCVALAVLSALRGGAHALLVWRLWIAAPHPQPPLRLQRV
ncbi:hypothetical protein VB716_03855 [Synechococcus sp. CCY9201]|nr:MULTISPECIES: hypothetical protein [unclassified Synechococcus]MEA5424102.1 hypothetical protein [Synechococcus sp. CCY9202]MEA5473350.1 hypothetical protein [Synechococcus sp. CCY9201]QPN59985.1 hypothetical protein H8F24_00210 [Synechococcus sp. CBW1002]QPN66790.1 hypothetical protein H8F26_00210 [Synechococcus sp. CBW1006]CAK6692072.1 hypothetical protein IFHNHDMJ_01144 [Synechococcus sp. CBW1107]